jgi:outer membrane protein assembly factor BamD
MTRILSFLLSMGLLVLISSACSTSDTAAPKARTAAEIFQEGKEKFDDGDYLDAQGLLEVIKLQYPSSQYADDAQYLLAEISFKRGEYLVAAFNYSMVRRSYPNSEFARDAMYKTGICYEELALPYDRDADYTRKAIQAYGEFQSAFPEDSLSYESVKRITALRDRLALRDLDVAYHYQKLGSYKASIVYFEQVMENFPETTYAEEAMAGKIRSLVNSLKIKEARGMIETYRRTYPNGAFKRDVDGLESEITF